MWKKIAATASVYAAAAAYYRYRPQPKGVNGKLRTYRVPAENIVFYHDTSWYVGNKRQNIHQIIGEITAMVQKAKALVVMDIFLFNLFHSKKSNFLPTTRLLAKAFQGKTHPCYFITDPFNTSYGTTYNAPINWLQVNGVNVCITNLQKLRDNNLIYSPLWRLLLQWLGKTSTKAIEHPLKKGKQTTLGAVLEALNMRANHRKIVIADDDDSYSTMVTSGNCEDSSSYFSNTALKVRSTAVARHFLEAEKAVARMSGCKLPATIPPAPDAGSALVTPLMGAQIKQLVLTDIRSAGKNDKLFLFTLFLADREIINALIHAAGRGAQVIVVLDPNQVSFGSKKWGFPNQIVAHELLERSSVKVRWSHSRKEEFHSKFVLLYKQKTCSVTLHTGSANFTRRSLSNTNLEANIRLEVPSYTSVAQQALEYAHWITQAPRTYPLHDADRSTLKYLWYRVQEATGIATF